MDKQPPRSEEPLSRREYRERLARQHDRPVDEQPKEMAESPVTGRQQYADEQKTKSAEEKTTVLRRKLNIAIIGLVTAIIAVYLILFYVG